MLRYTIDDLVEHSGYSRGMIYDLTCLKVLSPPVRGLDLSLYGSKGSYPAIVLKQLDRYYELKKQGLKKAEIIAILKPEVANVQVR